MRNERELLTNEILLERKEILLRVIDAIDELVGNKSAVMAQSFKNRGLSYLKTRTMLMRLSNCDTAKTSTRIEVSKSMELDIAFEPEEKLYFDVFGCNKKEWNFAKLPKDYKQSVLKVVSEGLSEKEQQIITLRYGLSVYGGEKEHTLEECAQIFNVTKEYIRQVHKRALRKLRKHPYVDMLSFGIEEYTKRMTESEDDLQKKRTPTPFAWGEIQYDNKKARDSFLFLPIEELSLSVRAYNCLYRNGIFFVFDIFAHRDFEIATLPGVGPHSHKEIIDSVMPFAIKCKTTYQDIHLFCQTVAESNGFFFDGKQSQASRLLKKWTAEEIESQQKQKNSLNLCSKDKHG